MLRQTCQCSPFKMGVLAMPMTRITPAEILQSVSGMFSGDDADARTLMAMRLNK